MANKSAGWTLEQLHRLPDDGNKYELIRGELFVTPAPSYTHESLLWVLSGVLEPYVRAHHLGVVTHPRAVIEVDGSEAEPDLAVRPIATVRPRAWVEAPLPILVVEVLSESTRRRDHLQKRTLYLDAGIPDYWIVSGEQRTIRVVRPGCDDVVNQETLTWHPSGAAAPLVVDVAGVFREALD